jgi:hypothetical protein
MNIEKTIKKIIVKIVMFVLGRSFQAASKMDSVIQNEIAGWDDQFVILMQVLPKGPIMCLKKHNDIIKYLGSQSPKADLVINFKNIESAFPVMAGLMGVEQGTSQNRMIVSGDIPIAMSFTRCINRLEAFLFPKIISRRLLKKVPSMGVKEQLIRIRLYCTGILFGF